MLGLQGPYHYSAIDATCADLSDISWLTFVSSDCDNGVLVDCFQLGVVFAFAFEIHLLEHVQSRLFTFRSCGAIGAGRGVKRTSQGPTGFVARDTKGGAILDEC